MNYSRCMGMTNGVGRCAFGVSVVLAILSGGGCSEILSVDWNSYEDIPPDQTTSSGSGCISAADCPPAEGECAVAVCEVGLCAIRSLEEGTLAATQVSGDCNEARCDGDGAIVLVAADDPRDDGSECTADSCDGGSNVHVASPEGTPCMQVDSGVCSSSGVCVECITGSDCTSGSCSASSTCESCSMVDVLAAPPSCSGGDPGAGNSCGSGAANCCDNKLVSCGAFLRGYDGIDLTDDTHPATLGDFRLDVYEVTVGRFRAFVDAGRGTKLSPPEAGEGASSAIPGSGWDAAWSANLTNDTAALRSALQCSASSATWTNAPGANEARPINCVTWYDAFAFCAWDGARLPTEAEWNYAASGGDGHRRFPWGPEVDHSFAVYGCLGDSDPDCSLADIRPVGSRSTKGDGRWGQADLAGNVWEWTLDVDGPYPLPCVNCAALTAGSKRVARGGSYANSEDFLRSGERTSDVPLLRAESVGVRCARNL